MLPPIAKKSRCIIYCRYVICIQMVLCLSDNFYDYCEIRITTVTYIAIVTE